MENGVWEATNRRGEKNFDVGKLQSRGYTEEKVKVTIIEW